MHEGKLVSWDDPWHGTVEGKVIAVDPNDGALYVENKDGYGTVWVMPEQVRVLDYNAQSCLACDNCEVLMPAREAMPVPAKNPSDGVIYWFSCRSQDCIDALACKE